MENDSEKKFPEGHFVGMWIGIGMAMFAGVGVALSTALDSPGLIGIGPALGVGFGAAIGQAVEKKKMAEGKVRPLTDAERKRRKRSTAIGVAVLAVGIVALFSLFLLR